MLKIIPKCFPEEMKVWEPKLKEMIPGYGKNLVENPELLKELHTSTDKALRLNEK